MALQLQTQSKALSDRSFVPAPGVLLQRKCACGGRTISGGECTDCRKNQLGLQRKAADQSEVLEVPPIVHEVVRAPGQPLDPHTRGFMEPRLGHDFSQVRVHTDAKAAESSRAVHAQAYTVGRDVVFGFNAYSPETTDGKRLIAHELTHVVQC